MNLNVADWKEFRFGDLISDIYKAKAINKDDLTITTDSDNAIRYITRTGENNGCELLADIRDIDSKTIEKGNAISIGDTTATCFYQAEDFITGDHMVVVRADSWLNSYTALYIVAILTNEQYKYSYGRAYLMDRIKDTIVKLPTDSDGNPDWQFMEEYIKSLHHKPLTTKNKSGQAPALNVQDWKYFLLKDICKITMGNKMDATAMTTDNPEYNFVGRSADDNGVAMKVDAVYTENDELIEPYPAGCITVALGGSLGSTYLQKEPFYTSQNVSVLEFPKEVSDSAKLFLCTLIHNESLYKYFPFGRELNTHIRTDFGFTIPVDSNGNPNWQFMEDYIKALPYGDRLEG